LEFHQLSYAAYNDKVIMKDLLETSIKEIVVHLKVFCRVFPAFRKNILPTSSVSNNKPSKNPARSRREALLSLLFDHENGGMTLLLNVGGLLWNYTALNPKS
jgi:hypothetical protein